MWYDRFVYRKIALDSGTRRVVLLRGGVFLRGVTIFLVVFVHRHELINTDVYLCA